MQPMTWQESLHNSLWVYLPSVLGALAILLVGWIVALVVAGAIRKGLGALKTNERLGAQTKTSIDFERIAGRVGFWALLLLTLIGVFSILHVDGVSGPLSTLATTVMMYVPRLLLALALALLGWLIATLVRGVVNKALGATRMDEKLSESADMQPLSNTMGNVAYWVVLLLFLPAIVGALQIDGLMIPLTNMTAEFLAILPNLFAATIIALVGWIIAKAVRGLVVNLLTATGIDRFSETREETKGIKLSALGGTLAFVMVLVPTLIAALDALRIQAISAPLTNMLGIFLAALPNVLAAAAILILAWFIGRLVADLVAKLLANLGFDRLPERIGLSHAFANSDASKASTADPAASSQLPLTADLPPAANPATQVQSTQSLSDFGGRLALFFIMLFATVEAAGLVGFDGVHGLLEDFIAFGADVLLGLVIFLVGFWLADVAAKAIERANPEGRGLAQIARVAILGLVLAMGLRAMGVADDIVNLAFGLILGAIAVAVALAFGLGGREAAASVANRWASRYLSRQRD